MKARVSLNALLRNMIREGYLKKDIHYKVVLKGTPDDWDSLKDRRFLVVRGPSQVEFLKHPHEYGKNWSLEKRAGTFEVLSVGMTDKYAFLNLGRFVGESDEDAYFGENA